MPRNNRLTHYYIMRELPYFQRFAVVQPSETGQKSVRVAVVRAGAGHG